MKPTPPPPSPLVPLDEAGRAWVDHALGALDLRGKVGQLMVFPHYGPFITPDTVRLLREHRVGGLRIAQKFPPGAFDSRAAGGATDPWCRPDRDTFDRPLGLERVACTAREFAATLNRLREIALERPGGVPLHFAFDQEGEGADFLFQQRLFPYPMGLVATGDPAMPRKAAMAIGIQARALGANMIHSPVVDVNTHPGNPEIGPRAYGCDPATVARHAAEAVRGFSAVGIAATAKHFPGRGHSDADAHFGLPVVDLDAAAFRRDHLAPFLAVIEADVPCVMAAFTAYPGLGAPGIPAATCRAIVTDILRGELGFTGVVTTDNVQMGGLLALYPMGEAVLRCLEAGCDLVLCRSTNPQRLGLLETVHDAVRSGRIPERRLDESVARILAMRWRMGLARDGGRVDASRAGDLFEDPSLAAFAQEASDRATTIVRNEDGMIPIPGGRRVLLVEQVHHFHRFINDSYAHPGMLWQELRAAGVDCAVVAVNEQPTEADRAAIRARLPEADLVVSTSYYNYRSHAIMLPVLEELRATGIPLVVVANTPFPAFGVPAWARTALVSYCPSGREGIRAIAGILAGTKQATATPPALP